MKVKKGIVTQKNGAKITIFDGEHSAFYKFNETASLIFEKLKKGLSRQEILDMMVNKYDIARKTAEKDFDQLVKEMKLRGIISD